MLRLQGHIGEAKTILGKLKDAGGAQRRVLLPGGRRRRGRGRPGPRRQVLRCGQSNSSPRHAGALFRLGFLNDLQGNDHEAIGFYERCLKYPPIGKGVLYNLGVLYEDNDQYDKATDCYRRLHKADPRDERAKLFVKDAEASLIDVLQPGGGAESASSSGR